MLFTLCERLFQNLVKYLGKVIELFSPRELYRPGVLNILLTLFMILGVTICYTYRRQIMDFYTAYKSDYSRIFVDEIENTSKHFDCFIAYCREDKATVTAILEELEKKPPYYKFCTRDRNWALGSYIPTNVFQSVSKSRKTLMILSGAFMENRWFHLQFQVAFHQVLKDKGHGLILVLKDLPDRTSLPRDIRYYLDTRSSLQWGETWFWERLRYSLEGDSFKENQCKDNIQYMIHHLGHKDDVIQEILEDIVI